MRSQRSAAANRTRATTRAIARVVLLAFALLLANTARPWAMAMHAPAHAAAATTHPPCHDSSAHKQAPRGGACSCCDAGCFCLQGAAPPPALALLPSPDRPAATQPRILARLPTPTATERLRPPIA